MPKIRSTKQLLGRADQRFLLFGMLAHTKEGNICLEDQDGFVELDFSQLVGIGAKIITLYFPNSLHPGPAERRLFYRRGLCSS